MNQKEFIQKMIGKPWVNRASNFDACDCYGLIQLYYQHVLNIDLPTVAGYDDATCSTEQGWEANIHDWEEVATPSENGLLFTSYKDEKPAHVGLVISPTHILHSRGFVDDPGKVEIHSIATLKKLFGKVTFHKYTGASNA